MAVCSSAAQIGGTVPVEHAFAHGEELEYAVSYKVSFVNTDAAGRFGDRDRTGYGSLFFPGRPASPSSA